MILALWVKCPHSQQGLPKICGDPQKSHDGTQMSNVHDGSQSLRSVQIQIQILSAIVQNALRRSLEDHKRFQLAS